MSPQAKQTARMAWKGSCVACRITLDFLYTLGVVLLAILVGLLIYFTSIDEIPVPQFLVRSLEQQAKAEGVAFEMDSISLHPNGKIELSNVTIKSTAFDAAIAEADTIAFDLDLTMLALGEVKVAGAQLINARIITPPVLSPSGTASTLMDQVNAAVEFRRQRWQIVYARFLIGDARFYARGDLPTRFLQPDPQKPPPDLRALLVERTPQLWELRNELARVEGLRVDAELSANASLQLQVDSLLLADQLQAPLQVTARNLVARLRYDAQGIDARAEIGNIDRPGWGTLSSVSARGIWEKAPTAEDYWPSHIEFSLDRVSRDGPLAHSLSGTLRPESLTEIGGRVHFQLGLQGWELTGQANLQDRSASINLHGRIDNEAVDVANRFTEFDLEPLVDLQSPPTIRLQADFDPQFKFRSAHATLDTGPVVANQAQFDRATGRASIVGPQISVRDLFARAGPQSGRFDIDYNLETRQRRFLIEGQFNPKHINPWFEGWWEGFWDNFDFGPDGFFIAMDSQAIFKKPDTLFIEGHAHGKNFKTRGHPVASYRSDLFIRLHYFDLYNVDLQREEGQATGEIQIALERDPRDDLEKLIGLWIDVDSTIDPSIGPDVLHELRQEVTDILEPYRYTAVPTIDARANSVRQKDQYNYDIDLKVATDQPIEYYLYPLQWLEADVHLENRKVLVRSARAGIGDGALEAEAEIIDDKLSFTTSLKDANFGKALKATVTYFEAQEPEEEEDDASEPYDTETLLEYGGVFNLDCQAEGILGDFQSFVGGGQAKVRDADLKKVHMLGLISMALEKTPLQMTTLKLTDAHGPFSINRRFIEFPELTLEGPIALMRSSGQYDLEAEKLDFRAQLFPFRKSRMPVTFVMNVLSDPFSRVLEFYITGDLEEPQISLFSQIREDPEEAIPDIEVPPPPPSPDT